jgi:surface carbohydrate biosynthesis protein
MNLSLFLSNFKIFFLKLRKILNSKISFSKIKNADVLIWGTPGFIGILNQKKYRLVNLHDANVIKIWGENYHFLVLLKCLFKFKFSLIDYSNEFIKLANPKIILSFLDNYNAFYLLKKNKHQKKILIQNASRTDEHNTFKKNKSYKMNSVDYVFCHNKEMKKKYEKLLGSRVYNTGSFLSNNFAIKQLKKKYDILYVSTFRKINKNNPIKNGKITWHDYLESEKNLITNIFKFSRKYKKKLFILPTNKIDLQLAEKDFFNKILGQNRSWQFVKRKPGDYKAAYKIVDQTDIIVGIDSTLLYESFGRGNKTIFFDVRPSNKFLDKTRHFAWPKKFSKSGPFWISNNRYKQIENILKKNISQSKFQSQEIYKKYANNLMNFDQDNETFYRIIKNHLND